jgi:hypothetical protein
VSDYDRATEEAIRQRLLRQIEAMDAATFRIRKQQRSSFAQWIYDTAFDVGYVLGAAYGTVRRWLDNWLDSYYY